MTTGDTLAGKLGRAFLLALLGLGGSMALLALVFIPLGALYVWITAGVDPWAQLRGGGWVSSLLLWSVVGLLFAGSTVAMAFLDSGPIGRLAIAVITLGLAVLWVRALRRGRAYRHAFLRQPR